MLVKTFYTRLDQFITEMSKKVSMAMLQKDIKELKEEGIETAATLVQITN